LENSTPCASRSAQDLLAEFRQTGQQEPFEEIVRRYAGMVFHTCYKITCNTHDAEDATQAVFLTLAVQAKTDKEIRCLGPWLQQVAHRLSLDLRKSKKRRDKREERHGEMTRRMRENADSSGPATQEELKQLLTEELNKLPVKYRLPLILHYFGGMDREAMARELHCKPSTLGVRLHRGREMLGARLAERGLLIGEGVLALALAQCIQSAVTDSLVSSTSTAATAVVLGRPVATGVVSMQVMNMARGAVHAVLMARIKNLTISALVIGTAVTAGAEVLSRVRPAELRVSIPNAITDVVKPLLRPISPVRRQVDATPATPTPTTPAAHSATTSNTGPAGLTASQLDSGEPFRLRAASPAPVAVAVPRYGGSSIVGGPGYFNPAPSHWSENLAAPRSVSSVSSPGAAPARSTFQTAALGSATGRGSTGSRPDVFSSQSPDATSTDDPGPDVPKDMPSQKPPKSKPPKKDPTSNQPGTGTPPGNIPPGNPITTTVLATRASTPAITIPPAADPGGLPNLYLAAAGQEVRSQPTTVIVDLSAADAAGTWSSSTVRRASTIQVNDLETLDAWVADAAASYGASKDFEILVPQQVNGSVSMANVSFQYLLERRTNTIPARIHGHSIVSTANTIRGYGTLGAAESFDQNGRVIADGRGLHRVLDLAGVNVIRNTQDNPPDGINGWFARDGGRLVMAPFTVDRGSGTYTWGESPADPEIDLINSVRIELANVRKATSLEVALLADDLAVVPPLPSGNHLVGLWQFTSPNLLADSISLQVRYDTTRVAELNLLESSLRLWAFNGRWDLMADGFALNTDANIISASTDSLAYFAVAGTDHAALSVSPLPAMPPAKFAATRAARTAVTPEPGGLLLLTAGLMALGQRRRGEKLKQHCHVVR